MVELKIGQMVVTTRADCQPCDTSISLETQDTEAAGSMVVSMGKDND